MDALTLHHIFSRLSALESKVGITQPNPFEHNGNIMFGQPRVIQNPERSQAFDQSNMIEQQNQKIKELMDTIKEKDRTITELENSLSLLKEQQIVEISDLQSGRKYVKKYNKKIKEFGLEIDEILFGISHTTDILSCYFAGREKKDRKMWYGELNNLVHFWRDFCPRLKNFEISKIDELDENQKIKVWEYLDEELFYINELNRQLETHQSYSEKVSISNVLRTINLASAAIIKRVTE